MRRTSRPTYGTNGVPQCLWPCGRARLEKWTPRMCKVCSPDSITLRTPSNSCALAATFQRWTEAHRTKIALKAVARARYLRLPSPGQRASHLTLQPPDLPPLRPLLHRPLRSRTPEEPARSTSDASTPADPAPFTRRRGLSSLLASRPASRAATTEDSSPRPIAPASSTGGDDRRERLWNELRGARLREPPGIGRAKSR